MTFSEGCHIAASGRYWGRSGHGVATANRSFVTRGVISRPSYTALRKAYPITSSACARSVGAAAT